MLWNSRSQWAELWWRNGNELLPSWFRSIVKNRNVPNPSSITIAHLQGSFGIPLFFLDYEISVRVILPDPKNREKDLIFASTESFPDAILARNCSCLLALHHLQPTLPLHQKLPEPCSSMWLKLTGMEDKISKKIEDKPVFTCSVCNKTFEKEMR